MRSLSHAPLTQAIVSALAVPHHAARVLRHLKRRQMKTSDEIRDDFRAETIENALKSRLFRPYQPRNQT